MVLWYNIPNREAVLREKEVGFPAESAAVVCDRVLRTPEPEQSAQCSAERGGLVVRI